MSATSPSCWGTHFLYLSNPPSGNLLPIIPWSARPWSQQKQTSIPSQCVSILFRRNFYISSGCIESLTCFKKCFSALYLSFVWVSSVGESVVNVEYFLDISCWCSDVPDAASPRYKPLLSPDDKMLTIIGDRTLGLAMARYVYWATDLSVSSPMISDCSQFLHSQGVQQLTFITFIALFMFMFL